MGVGVGRGGEGEDQEEQEVGRWGGGAKRKKIN